MPFVFDREAARHAVEVVAGKWTLVVLSELAEGS